MYFSDNLSESTFDDRIDNKAAINLNRDGNLGLSIKSFDFFPLQTKKILHLASNLLQICKAGNCTKRI